MLNIEIRVRKGKGRNPVCPVCKRQIEADEPRIETYVFGSQTRQFHFPCAKALANKILFALEVEEGSTDAENGRT